MSQNKINKNIDNLLGEVCVIFGFCIPVDQQNIIASKGRWRAEEFAKDVISAEGLNPEYELKHLRDIRNHFIQYFGSSEYVADDS